MNEDAKKAEQEKLNHEVKEYLENIKATKAILVILAAIISLAVGVASFAVTSGMSGDLLIVASIYLFFRLHKEGVL